MDAVSSDERVVMMSLSVDGEMGADDIVVSFVRLRLTPWVSEHVETYGRGEKRGGSEAGCGILGRLEVGMDGCRPARFCIWCEICCLIVGPSCITLHVHM